LDECGWSQVETPEAGKQTGLRKNNVTATTTTAPFKIPSHRPEIDGLRALAILGVLLYHANLGCGYGYIGVDVFFTISGFLITGIILREMEEGTFSVARFWTRRVRRIFPALAACLAGTLIAGYYLLLPTEMSALATQTLAALALVANYQMHSLLSWYWGQNSESIPLLHTWSLSIEEQFYIFLPFILLIVHRYAPKRKGLTLALLFAASIALCHPLVGCFSKITRFPIGTAFYFLPFRAWELLLGSLGAYALQKRVRLPQNIAVPLSAVGLCTIVYAMFDLPSAEQWPNLWALLPTGGALCILMTPQPEGQPHIVARMLSHPVPRFLGLISYSLYLWHWPLLVLVNQTYGLENVTTADRWGLAAAAVALAALSWKFIEQPFRQKTDGRIVPARQLIWGAGLAWTALTIAACLTLQNHGFEKQFLARLNPQIRKIIIPPPFHDYGAAGCLVSGGVQFNTLGRSPRVVVLGDSHACSLGPLFQAISQEENIPVAMLAQNAAPGFFGGTNKITIADQVFSIDKSTRDEQVKHWITLWKPDLIILAGRWEGQMTCWGPTLVQSSNALAQVTHDSTKWLADHAKKVVVLTQVPYLPLGDFDVCPQLRKLIHGTKMPRLTERHMIEDKRTNVIALLRRETDPRVTIIDLVPHFTNPDGTIRYYGPEGCFYRDSNHLNRNGAMEVRPLLDPLFQGLRQNNAGGQLANREQ
jgi:peptidoglycan/LPS O-acetylase OafA/YrhL